MAKATKAAARRKAGYKDHVVGSRKGRMHEAYDKQGGDAAQTLGVKLGLKASTLRTWMATWRRANAKGEVCFEENGKGRLKRKPISNFAPADDAGVFLL
jgi:hypothetical protein